MQILNPVLNSLNTFFQHYFKQANLCPVCNTQPDHFLPLPEMYQENAQKYGYKYFGRGEMTSLQTYSCPLCGASDRERLYALYIRKLIEKKLLHHSTKMIHFAPEGALQNMLRQLNVFEYITADLTMSHVDYTVDITQMDEFEDACCDCFICSHVLEHVEDDIASLRELYRILKPGGWGILMSPIILGLEKTIEHLNVTTDAERWKYFGQHDHVRLYAKDDYISRVKQQGFHVKELDKKYFGKSMFTRLGLKPTSVLYIVEKL